MPLSSPRASATTGQITAPLEFGGDPSEHRRLIAQATEEALEGKLRSVGTVTLTASQGSTTLADLRIGAGSVILLMPTTANAAAALATTYQTVPNATKGEAVLNHANNAQTDRTFKYVVLG